MAGEGAVLMLMLAGGEGWDRRGGSCSWGCCQRAADGVCGGGEQARRWSRLNL